MKIVVASGKGGTGKTTVSVNLAWALAGRMTIGLLDCDVEEPDCHLYMKPPFSADRPVGSPVPIVNEAICIGCGQCARACEFHALVALPEKPLLLPELCHGCGVCGYICPEEAISDGEREVGVLGAGWVDKVYFRWGRLNLTEARSTPVIKAVKDLSGAPPLDMIILDAPPGVACPAVEAMRDSDFALLVAEPTSFGLHDLRLAVETVREIGLPFGVVLNRAGIGDDRVHRFCVEERVPILLTIPDDRRLAEAGARGKIFAATHSAFASHLRMLAAIIRSRLAVRTTMQAPVFKEPVGMRKAGSS